jgi:hypothetical protein
MRGFKNKKINKNMKHIKLFESFSNTVLYHGSYHKFDNFDMSKISNNTSQTTYGYGIYMTDSKPYANSYISGENGENGEMLEDDKGYLYEITLSKANFLNFGESVNGKVEYNTIDKNNYDRIIKGLEEENIQLIDRDDNPISLTLNTNTWSFYSSIANTLYDNMTIKEKFTNGYFLSKKMTSEFLKRCGIDGIKYPLDNSFKMSTSYGHTGFGYVLYDTDIIESVKIIE